MKKQKINNKKNRRKKILPHTCCYFNIYDYEYLWQRIHVGMDEMYEIAQQAKHRYLGIDEISVQNW